ncbi:flagellar FlbD family protein [Nocardioides sp. LS1]|uniref:flagellar FlbD family protein n=1 Tax=Nocardioides sp. LS1 TaxID=1027620 RepID=UPI000F620BA5|nr:flagellar FlbD family protein [Nocardioides sp. LS1]GCD89546.1 hypothetical protein NLS1_15520 [Nocardioides sp. LS1]
MITLTRLSGSVFALNADLIERVDATPDTVVTLVDGKKYVVTDSVDQIVSAVRRHRGEIIAMSNVLAFEQPGHHAGHGGPSTHRTDEPRRLGTVTELTEVAAARRTSSES